MNEPIASPPPSLRQVPPWLSPPPRSVERAFFAVAALCLALGGLAYTDEAMATPLAGRVESIDVRRPRRPFYDVEYTFDDASGARVWRGRDLSPDEATRAGITGVGAPIEVRSSLGFPQLRGLPNYLAEDFLYASLVSLVLGLGALGARVWAARKVRLLVEGELVRGWVQLLPGRFFDGRARWRFSYAFRRGEQTHVRAQSLTAAKSLGGFAAVLGLRGHPTETMPVVVACDPANPRRSVLYAMQDAARASAPMPAARAVAELPTELREEPRALPASAPRLHDALHGGHLVYGAGIAVLSAVVIAGAFFDRDNPHALVGGGTFALLAGAFTMASLRGPVARSRALLTHGVARVAVVTDVLETTGRGACVWVSLEADTPEGTLVGREQVLARRLARMGGAPKVGDTVFLVVDRERPWEREIAGFARGVSA